MRKHVTRGHWMRQDRPPRRTVIVSTGGEEVCRIEWAREGGRDGEPRSGRKSPRCDRDAELLVNAKRAALLLARVDLYLTDDGRYDHHRWHELCTEINAFASHLADDGLTLEELLAHD